MPTQINIAIINDQIDKATLVLTMAWLFARPYLAVTCTKLICKKLTET